MEGATLQDWVTIRAVGHVTVAQGEPFWLDLSAYRDAIAWLHVAALYVSGGDVSVRLSYETAPTADEALFALVGGPIVLQANTVTVTQMLGSIANPPLARLFRWKLSVSGATSSTWDATFRVLVALNRPGYRTSSNMAAGAGSKLPMMPAPPWLSGSAQAYKPSESAMAHKPSESTVAYKPPAPKVPSP